MLSQSISKYLKVAFAIVIFNQFMIAQSYPPATVWPESCLSESLAPGDTIMPVGYQYICTDPNLVKYLKVNIHFLSPGLVEKAMKDCVGNTEFKYLGLGNFTPYSNGFNTASLDPVGILDYYYNGFQRAEDIINKCNDILADNHNQWRRANDINVQNPPADVTYPETPPSTNVRFILSGVYFHEDPRAVSSNINNDLNYFQSTYGVNKETEINVFMASEFTGYYSDGSGVANTIGGSSKYNMVNLYYKYTQPACRDWSLKYSASTIVHEIGHNLSLYHTWNTIDNTKRCLDAPLGYVYDKWDNGNCYIDQHANCWAHDDNREICPGSTKGYPCDDWYKISNNIMDYNQYSNALTVCQIGRMQSDLAGPGNQYIYSCNGCAPANAFFYMNDVFICPSLSEGSSVFFNGEASYNEDHWVLEICEVASASSQSCIGNYYTTGVMSGQVSKFNLTNIYNFPIATTTKYYKIKLTVGNSTCLPDHSYTKIISVGSCLQPQIEPEQYLRVRVTNPVSDYLNILYTVKEAANISVRLINIYSGNIIPLESPSNKGIGDYYINYPTSGIASGTYTLQFVYNNIPFNHQLVVL